MVVFCLIFFNDGFDRDEFECGVVVEEEEAVPEATYSSVAVLEGVDGFELVVEDAGADERVGLFVF